jgi:hypothetical protein
LSTDQAVITYRRESHLFISLPLAADSGSAARRVVHLVCISGTILLVSLYASMKEGDS